MNLCKALVPILLFSLSTQVLSEQRETSYRYDKSGRILEFASWQAGERRKQVVSYDDRGFVASYENALGHKTIFNARNYQGLAESISLANGLLITNAYDDRGLLQSSSLGGRQIENSYSLGGRLLASSKYGRLTSFTYDAQGRLETSVNSLGEYTRNWYDDAGNVTRFAIYSEEGLETYFYEFSYDDKGRLRTTLGAEGQSLTQEYDRENRLKRDVDALGNGSENFLDGFGRPVVITDSLGGTTHMEYGAEGSVRVVQDAEGSTTRYSNNVFQEKLIEASPDAGLTRYERDQYGQVVSKTDPRGVVTSYSYDELGRLVSWSYSSESPVVYTLSYDYRSEDVDNTGSLRSISSEASSIQYEYDPYGNATEITQRVFDDTYQLSYAYNQHDEVIAQTYPSGRKVEYSRNEVGNVIALSESLSGDVQSVVDVASYMPLGPLKSLVYANGVDSNLTYDKSYRVNGISVHKGSGALDAKNYEYDVADNILGLSEAEENRRREFAYDRLYRLTQEKGEYGEKYYEYDKVGNRLRREHHYLKPDLEPKLKTQVLSYQEGSNRLTAKGRQQFSYDAAGNITSSRNDKRRYEYGVDGRLAAYYLDDRLIAEYFYNGLGQRVRTIKHTESGIREFQYVYSQEGRLLARYTYPVKGKAKLIEYIWLDSRPVMQIRSKLDAAGQVIVSSQKKVWLHSDHLMTPRFATNPDGKMVWRWNSDAFGVGNPEKDVDGDGKKVNVLLRFPGQFVDVGPFFYNYFRDYKPNLGRYVQSDPIGLQGGLNTYTYALGNPFLYSDRMGLSVWSFLWQHTPKSLGQDAPSDNSQCQACYLRVNQSCYFIKVGAAGLGGAVGGAISSAAGATPVGLVAGGSLGFLSGKVICEKMYEQCASKCDENCENQ